MAVVFISQPSPAADPVLPPALADGGLAGHAGREQCDEQEEAALVATPKRQACRRGRGGIWMSPVANWSCGRSNAAFPAASAARAVGGPAPCSPADEVSARKFETQRKGRKRGKNARHCGPTVMCQSCHQNHPTKPPNNQM